MRKLIVALLVVLLPIIAKASWNVWPEPIFKATSGHDKVQKTYDPGTYPTSFSIKAAKNEYCIFQLAARSSGEPMVGFTPSIQTTFTSGANTIPDSNITFYLENFIATTGTYNTGSAAYETAGDWPDILVPYKDRFYNETRNGTDSGWGQTVVDGTVTWTCRGYTYLNNQILGIELKDISENPRVWRISPSYNEYTGNYRDEGSAAISQDGDSIFWTSNWNDAAAGHGEVYSVDIDGWYDYFSGVQSLGTVLIGQ